MKQTGILVWILVGLAVTQAHADGKVFRLLDKVPPDIPYQRALLIHDEGTETLVVQSRYDVSAPSPEETLGWVVPVPSVPGLASMDADVAWGLFLTASLRTSPKVRHVSIYFLLPTFALLLSSAAILVLRSSGGHHSKKQRRRRLAYAILLTVLAFLVGTVFMPPLSGHREGLEIVKSEDVGIYSVKVIRGDSAEPVMAWLKDNDFAFNEEDAAALADYVARGWCFVTAKIRPEAKADESSTSAEGLAAPLVLTFDANDPVYPLALTATAGTETEILLYTLTDTKLTCNDRLKLRHAAKMNSRRITDELLVRTGTNETQPMAGLPDKPMMLCKFKGTMTAEQMREDLVFEPAPDNASYRETIWTWQ